MSLYLCWPRGGRCKKDKNRSNSSFVTLIYRPCKSMTVLEKADMTNDIVRMLLTNRFTSVHRSALAFRGWSICAVSSSLVWGSSPGDSFASLPLNTTQTTRYAHQRNFFIPVSVYGTSISRWGKNNAPLIASMQSVALLDRRTPSKVKKKEEQRWLF